MNITNTSSAISTHDFRKNGEWEVYGTSSEWAITVLDCCPGTYSISNIFISSTEIERKTVKGKLRTTLSLKRFVNNDLEDYGNIVDKNIM